MSSMIITICWPTTIAATFTIIISKIVKVIVGVGIISFCPIIITLVRVCGLNETLLAIEVEL